MSKTITTQKEIKDEPIKEYLTIIAKILEIESHIDKGYWNHLDMTFSDQLKKLYWHYKDNLNMECLEIWNDRQDRKL